MTGDSPPSRTVTDDVCTLPLARRLAALLDRDPDTLREGDPLPRGWHVMMFNRPTRQAALRADGAADLGVEMPAIGLPRLMLGGRDIRFLADIPLGASARRVSDRGGVVMKTGRSGPFALVGVEHRIYIDGNPDPAIIETNSYVLRPAADTVAPLAPPAAVTGPVADSFRIIVPDEPMLFRYSAITDNPHRIHYDQAYAMGVEGYPALVVNGSLPAMFLLEMFRSVAGREPDRLHSRNLMPMYCGRELTLGLRRDAERWHLWADAAGRTAFDAHAE